ncbi:ABC transporter ATP-binding protein [Glycomyces harbinensis]|uniref:Multiple sugar transport system ATP-binding protein n=1 Tax=Glycomyces harbinensis TaxID=58114 RepID=A0A1G6UAJ0_9ACTN|nr:ABC transporter ATP-binding protein [Glycomyces harbinensis]SDD38301.1 multiple sugar transport system ATP-binding protein [Glycomyces harbinensis]
MPRMVFDHVTKSFGSDPVIDGFSAEIADREFLVLLGPSGCGKSTMLRMIAGLADVSGGTISFDGRVVNGLEPRERDIAFVFQSYALYPHMTVAQNIAFPLVMGHFRPWYHLPVLSSVMKRAIARRPEVADKVAEVARVLELTEYLDRRPKSLSGGQRQRVALARSLVRDPSVYLLDEPLSNLDAKLRTQMRSEITGLHRRVRKSFVYVTHDQVEAMTMATRIIVLDRGRIQQIGTPEEIYTRPANAFVARFIGSPGMNLVPATAAGGLVHDRRSGQVLDTGTGLDDGEYRFGLRPEAIRIAADGEDGLAATLTTVEHLGGEIVAGFRLGHHDADDGVTVDLGDTVFARLAPDPSLRAGARRRLVFDRDAVGYFSAATGLRVPATRGTTQPQGSNR